MIDNNKIIAAIRTAVAAGVGFGLVWVSSTLGVPIDENSQAAVIAVAVSLASGAYNYVINKLTEKFPAVGFLLGIPKIPTYNGEK